jgi:hypothetical protein
MYTIKKLKRGQGSAMSCGDYDDNNNDNNNYYYMKHYYKNCEIMTAFKGYDSAVSESKSQNL